jgi:hypothetical protein
MLIKNFYQNDEKENRAAELIIANKEHQNDEKENRAAELIIANKELTKMTRKRIVRQISCCQY